MGVKNVYFFKLTNKQQDRSNIKKKNNSLNPFIWTFCPQVEEVKNKPLASLTFAYVSNTCVKTTYAIGDFLCYT